MADSWISGLSRPFFWCALISVQQNKGVDGWEEGEGRDGWERAQPTIQHCLEQEKPPKVAYAIPQGQGGI